MEYSQSPDLVIIFLAGSVMATHELFGSASLLGIEVNGDLVDLGAQCTDKKLVACIVEAKGSDTGADCLEALVNLDLHNVG